MNIYAKFQLHPLMASEKKIFEYFFGNLAFRLQWQPIKNSNLDQMYMVGRGLLQKHFCKTFFKISAVTQKLMPISTFPIISLWKHFSCHSNESTYAMTKKKKKKNTQTM